MPVHENIRSPFSTYSKKIYIKNTSANIWFVCFYSILLNNICMIFSYQLSIFIPCLFRNQIYFKILRNITYIISDIIRGQNPRKKIYVQILDKKAYFTLLLLYFYTNDIKLEIYLIVSVMCMIKDAFEFNSITLCSILTIIIFEAC